MSESRLPASTVWTWQWHSMEPWKTVFFFFFRGGWVFWDKVSLCNSGCPGTHSVDQADLNLTRDPPASASASLPLCPSAPLPLCPSAPLPLCPSAPLSLPLCLCLCLWRMCYCCPEKKQLRVRCAVLLEEQWRTANSVFMLQAFWPLTCLFSYWPFCLLFICKTRYHYVAQDSLEHMIFSTEIKGCTTMPGFPSLGV
jgi:hypothetical protein